MRLIKASLFILITTSVFGQFASKKAEKLYNKLDDAYLDYDYATILENEEEAKSTFLTNEDTVAANVYSFLAEAYDYELGDLKRALEFYNLELKIREKVDPNGDRKDLFYNMATLQTELGFYRDAENLLVTIRDSDEKEFGKKSVEFYDATSFLIQLYNQTEQIDKIVSLAEDLRKNVEKNSIEEAVTYMWEGDAYTTEGSNKKAERSFARSLDRFQSNGLEGTFEYASALNSLGILYTNMGKLPEAEEVYQDALSIIDRIQGDNEDARAGIQGNLAQVYFGLGDYERAIEIQTGLVAEAKEYYGEGSFDYGISLINLGLSLLYDGQYVESEKIHLEALKVFEKSAGKEGIDYGRVENNLSLLYTKRGYIDKAIDFGQKAIETYSKAFGPTHPESAFPNYNLANAYMGYEQMAKAEPLAKKAYTIRKNALGVNHPLFAKSSNQMAIVSWKKGEIADALDYYKQTFDNYFKQINSFFPVLTEEEKAKFYYTNVRPAFEQYVSFIQQNSSENKELIGEIYDYQLALKGLIMYATSKVRESILSSGDVDLISKYEEWISQKEQLAKLFSASDLSLAQRNKKIDSLTEISNTLEEELSKKSNVFGENFANKKLSWRDVQKTLKPGEAAIEMVRYRVFSSDSAGVFTDEAHYAALIVKADTEDYPELVIIRNGADMEKKYLSNYRNAIRYKVAENYSYRLFWKPIANRLEGINKIYFAPDGVYNQISIYTLQNPDTKEYLLNEIDVAVVTNTKDLVAGKLTKPTNPNQSVFFGFPDYNLGSSASGKEEGSGDRGIRGADRGMRSGDKGSLERGATIPRGIRGNLVRYMRSFNGLAMLPGTKKEVELIDSLYKASNRPYESYFLNEAVENKIKELKSPSTLHIATHGFFLELDPEDAASNDKYVENPLLRSGLIMAGANSFIRTGVLAPEQGDDDGILTAYEAMNLNLDNTDIVVLSACETGLGEIKNGEGVYGLQRAFQIAGADAIIMSMWSVDDDATQELMTTFYQEWLQHGDKQKAFNTAQKQLKDKYKNPYFWGAFVMVGN